MAVVKYPFDEVDPKGIREWVKAQDKGAILDFAWLKMQNAHLYGLDDKLKGAQFNNCDLTGAVFNNSNLDDVNFSDAILVGTSLLNTNCISGGFYQADVKDCDFLNCNVGGATFEKTKNLSRAKNLEFCKVNSIGDVHDLDKLELDYFDRKTTWESIRKFGKLPLFGVSYIALLVLPMFYYLIAFYNTNVSKTLDYIETLIPKADPNSVEKFIALKESIQMIPIPKFSLVFYVGTVCLAIASSLYAWKAPDRVKEYSSEEWQHSNNKQLIHYLGYSWKNKRIRITCMSFYIIGGGAVIFFVAHKLWNAWGFIISSPGTI